VSDLAAFATAAVADAFSFVRHCLVVLDGTTLLVLQLTPLDRYLEAFLTAIAEPTDKAMLSRQV